MAAQRPSTVRSAALRSSDFKVWERVLDWIAVVNKAGGISSGRPPLC